jgi:hypothetical protein
MEFTRVAVKKNKSSKLTGIPSFERFALAFLVNRTEYNMEIYVHALTVSVLRLK